MTTQGRLVFVLCYILKTNFFFFFTDFIRKPTFIDLGCGNGLLTYLLTSEGYQGYGIDVAERKIWSKLRNGKDDQLRGKKNTYHSQF